MEGEGLNLQTAVEYSGRPAVNTNGYKYILDDCASIIHYANLDKI